MIDALNALARPAPSGMDLWSPAERWGAHLDDQRDLDWFAGDTLLLTDWDPANVVITAAGEARVAGWSWATRGPAWVEPACLVPWLIAAGHEPADAELWALQVTAWSEGPDRALDLFALVQARHWAATALAAPGPTADRLRDAAARWVGHRGPPAP